MKIHKLIVGVVACAMLCSMNDALGFYSESTEDDTPAIWDTPFLALDSGGNNVRATDVRHMLDETERSVSIDFFSEREDPTGWGVYGADLKLGLETDNAWTALDVTAGGKANGTSSTPGWDAASWIDRVLDVGHTNSAIPTSWFLNTWAEEGMDSGLHNGYLDNIAAIPEQATYGLITIFGGGLLLFRRRLKA